MDDPFDLWLEPRVVAADDWLVAVAKPARMHTAPGRSGGCLCDWAFERFPDAARAGAGGTRPAAEGGLLHRLDFETSGLVLFARTPEAFAFLLKEQEEGRLRKDYIARSHPSTDPQPTGSRPPRSAPEGLEEGLWHEALAAQDPCGEAAAALGRAIEEGFRIVSSFKPFGPGAARVACLSPAEARPGTRSYSTRIVSARAREGGLELVASIDAGFRHQIRAHLAWIGLPILGDPLYGGRAAPRLFLHAARLAFAHPRDGRPVELRCE